MKRNKSSHIDRSSANYRHWTICVSDVVGAHQIPVFCDAMHPKDLISSEAVHYELVKMVFRRIYRANHCYHLNAEIDCHKTFDVLGDVHAELQNSGTTDIAEINLLLEIGEATRDFFERFQHAQSTSKSRQSSVLRFPQTFRIN